MWPMKVFTIIKASYIFFELFLGQISILMFDVFQSSVDIMPYSTEDKAPIQHDLFDRFLQLKEGAEEGGK